MGGAYVPARARIFVIPARTQPVTGGTCWPSDARLAREKLAGKAAFAGAHAAKRASIFGLARRVEIFIAKPRWSLHSDFDILFLFSHR